MKTLNEYINENYDLLVEAVRSSDMNKALNLIKQLLKKRGITTYNFTNQYVVDGQNKIGMMCANRNDEGAMFLWSVGNTAEIDSVIFTKNIIEARADWADGKPHICDIEVEAKGASITKMCQLVLDVLTGKLSMNLRDMNEYIYDAQMFESLGDEEEMINEDGLQNLMKQKTNLYMKIRDRKKKGKEVEQSLQDEYDNVVELINKAKINTKAKVSVSEVPDKDMKKWQDWLDRECAASPEERFDDMISAVDRVIKGIRPLALVCGAPGVGKTFRIMQAVKKAGLKMNEGYNLFKGSTTPAALFTCLADFREKGQVMIFDDCDAIFKDPECINLLKAAYDSSDERWVSWNSTRLIPARDQELAKQEPDFYELRVKSGAECWCYPQQYLYEGSGIIITNYTASYVDTAIKNRAVVVDLSFTNKECMDLIVGIKDTIKPDIFPEEVKDKAIAYLYELIDKDVPVGISVRTFVSCMEEFYTSADEKAIRRRIALNLKLQAERGGAKKY